VRFSYRMVPEVYQVFWAGMAAGEFINDAAIAAGSYRKQGTRWLAAAGGVRPRRGRGLRGRCLTLAQREEIALGRARGDSIRTIAALLGRSPSTVSRELRRNTDGLGRYRATTAHALAYHRASRPKPGKLVQNLELRGKVEADLAKKYSGADRGTAEGRVSRSAGDGGEHRDHLPVAVCAVPRRLETRTDQVFADWSCGAAAVEEGRATQEPDPEHDQHLRTSCRGRGSGRARPLGISMMLSSRRSEVGRVDAEGAVVS
jgi:DNA-binding CsgD family transcriptional regulator